jgi:hypothetical protein
MCYSDRQQKERGADVRAGVKRRGIEAVMVLGLLAMPAAGAPAAIGPATARGATRPSRAHAARSLRASDTAHLRYVSASGSLLFEAGRATGTLPGAMRVHFDVGAILSGSFTIDTRGGTIKGHGSAKPHGSGEYESFAGSLTVTGGSGEYAHAHGTAGLYGTFDRETYALLVQTTGTLSY